MFNYSEAVATKITAKVTEIFLRYYCYYGLIKSEDPLTDTYNVPLSTVANMEPSLIHPILK